MQTWGLSTYVAPRVALPFGQSVLFSITLLILLAVEGGRRDNSSKTGHAGKCWSLAREVG